MGASPGNISSTPPSADTNGVNPDKSSTGQSASANGNTQVAQEWLGPLIDGLGARAPFETVNPIEEQFKIPAEGLSGKEGATNVPSWARGLRPRVGKSGGEEARRAMDNRWGKGKWKKIPDRKSEFRKIQKYFDRHFQDPPPPADVPTNMI